MTTSKFRNLKIGDKVVLANSLAEYSCGHKTPDGKVYVKGGTEGEVAVLHVPSARCENVYFHCIDFPTDIELIDCNGRKVEHWGKTKLIEYGNKLRVAAKAVDLV